MDSLVAARTIHFAATALVAGIVCFEWLVAEPVLYGTGGKPSALAIRFRDRLALVLWISLAVALISAAAWLVLVAAGIVDKPVSEVIQDGTAWTVFTQTRFGLIWQLRLLFAVLLGGHVWIRQRAGGYMRWSSLLAAALAATFVGALAWAGHGGATPGNAGIIHVSADVLHLVAAAAWLGGLVPLILLLVSLRRPDADRRMTIAAAACQRFSSLGIFSVATLLISGLTNAWFLVGNSQGLNGTPYGQLLTGKLLLFFGMVCIAAVNRQYLTPSLGSGLENADPDADKAAARLARNAALELLLGLAVVVVVAALGITTPATEQHVHVHG